MNILEFIDYLIDECGYTEEMAEEAAYQAFRDDL